MISNRENKVEEDDLVITPARAERCVNLLSKNNECKSLTALLDTYFVNDSDEPYKQTALHIAAENRSTEAVALLLKYHHYRVGVNSENQDGLTALDLAHPHQEIQELLKKHGAKKGSHIPENKIEEHSYFLLPKRIRNMHGFELLQTISLESRAYDESTSNLIMLVTKNDEEKTLADLINDSNELNKRFARGRTVLHEAVENNSLKALSVLLSSANKDKINLNIKDYAGNTAAHIAAALDSTKALEALFIAKADFRKKNTKELTPLSIAAIHGSTSCLEYLSKNLKEDDYLSDLIEAKERLQQAVKTQNSPVSLTTTSQTLFPPEYPEFIRSLAKEIDIPPKELKTYHDANDGRFSRLNNLKWYIENSLEINHPDPRFCLNKQNALATSDQELKNLITCKHHVMRGIFSVTEVKDFTEPERELLDQAYLIKAPHSTVLKCLTEFREEQRSVQRPWF